MTKAPLPGAAISSKGLLQGKNDLPMVRASDAFDPDAYKLMEESKYDFSKPPSVRYIIDTKPYGSNDKQKVVQKKGDEVMTPRIGLGYMPPQLMKILRQCKDQRSLTQSVMMEEAGNDKVTMLCLAQNYRCSTGCDH